MERLTYIENDFTNMIDNIINPLNEWWNELSQENLVDGLVDSINQWWNELDVDHSIYVKLLEENFNYIESVSNDINSCSQTSIQELFYCIKHWSDLMERQRNE